MSRRVPWAASCVVVIHGGCRAFLCKDTIHAPVGCQWLYCPTRLRLFSLLQLVQLNTSAASRMQLWACISSFFAPR
jgi:hypothetical protein